MLTLLKRLATDQEFTIRILRAAAFAALQYGLVTGKIDPATAAVLSGGTLAVGPGQFQRKG